MDLSITYVGLLALVNGALVIIYLMRSQSNKKHSNERSNKIREKNEMARQAEEREIAKLIKEVDAKSEQEMSVD